MQQYQPVLGPVFFTVYVTVVLFVGEDSSLSAALDGCFLQRSLSLLRLYVNRSAT